jgi:hypothetical protein
VELPTSYRTTASPAWMLSINQDLKANAARS